MLRLLATVAVPLLLWTATASAQIFYVTSGGGGTVQQVPSTGAPLSNLVDYGATADVQGISVAGNGDLYVSVSDSGTSTINRVTSGGSSSVFSSLSNQALGLSFNSGGVLYGVSGGGGPSGGHDVGIFSAGGFIPLTLTSAPFAPFFSAQSLRFDGNGNIFVTNSGAGGDFANSVVKLTPNGSSWDISEFADTTGLQAYDVAFDTLGNVFVTSANNGGGIPIRKYSSAGAALPYTTSGEAFSLPRGIVFAEGSLYTADRGFTRVIENNPTSGVGTVFVSSLTQFPTYIAYSVPEPSQVALMLLGGLFFVGTMRRNRAPKAC